jgi:hypothetical protein
MGFSVPLVSKAASLALVSGQVLVVEDNAEVGEFSSQLLRDLGYQTVLASNAAEALIIFLFYIIPFLCEKLRFLPAPDKAR